jgi:uncharacterized peroxidase-related enzyme
MKAGISPCTTDAQADAFVHAIARDWRTAPLNEIDQAICTFAEKITLNQHKMSPADLDHLRSLGMDDRGISDATQVIAYFNYITRIADTLGVEAEDFIEPWGLS